MRIYRTTEEIQELVQNDYYKSFAPHLLRMLRFSLSNKTLNDPVMNISVQLAILQVLEELEPKISEGRKLAKENNGDKQLLIQADRNKLIAKTYRSIADGIAFRQLGYNRFRFRVLSQAHHAGPVADAAGPKAGRRNELKYALNAVSGNGFILIHDITNNLRLADLSLFLPPDITKPYLGEVKSKRIITASTISAKLDAGKATSNQEKRLIQAQLCIEAGSINGPSISSRAIYFNRPIKHYLREVSKLVDKVNVAGYSWFSPHPVIIVEAINIATLMRIEELKFRKLQNKPSLSAEPCVQFSSGDIIDVLLQDEVMRSKAPYAVYPFTKENRIKIINGETIVRTILYPRRLIHVFAARGWDLVIDEANDSSAAMAEMAGTLHGPILFSDPQLGFLFHAKHPNGFNVKLAWEHIAQIGYEFFSPDYMVDICEAMMRNSRPGDTENAILVNVAEAAVWR